MPTIVTPRKWLILPFLLLVQLAFAGSRADLPSLVSEEPRGLAITHTLSHELVAVGDTLSLIFSLLNHDPLAARGVEIHVTLPETACIESYKPERGEFLESEGVWRLAHLAGGNDVSLQLNLLNTSNVDITFSASIELAEPQADPIPQNNITQGVIRVKDEDCMVVYNNFSECSDGSSSFLYVACAKEYPNNVLYIYDRWGNLVYEQEHYDNSWNGKRHPRFTRQGWDDLPSGTYYYVLSFPKADRADKSGRIYLSD